MAVCLTGRVSVLCVCLCECVSGTHMKLCCWLNLQTRGQQPCPSACAETPGGLQQLGRTILGSTGLYWAVLGSSGQLEVTAAPVILQQVLSCSANRGSKQMLSGWWGSWQDGAGTLPGLMLAAVLSVCTAVLALFPLVLGAASGALGSTGECRWQGRSRGHSCCHDSAQYLC